MMVVAGDSSHRGQLAAVLVLITLSVLLAACNIPAGKSMPPTLAAMATSASPSQPDTSPQASNAVLPAIASPPTWTPKPSPTAEQTPTPTPTSLCNEPGQVVQGQFPSKLAPPGMDYRIYLPPCYGSDGRTYPLLIMLPGNVHNDGIWDTLGLDEAAEEGILAELLPPMLIVKPDGGQNDTQTSGGPYSYEGVILNELLPFIETSYCASPRPADRAIGGLSRGGYWALEIAFRNPETFASVAGHSAALVDTYAGPNLDPKYTALTSDLGLLRIYLDAGRNDWYLGPLNILHQNLLAAGRDHVWIIQEGGHTEAYWSAHVADYLAWYAQAWSSDRWDYAPCSAGS